MGRKSAINQKERWDEIQRLRKVDGLSWQAIADRLGLHIQTLFKFRQSMQIKEMKPKTYKSSGKPWLEPGKNVVAVDATGHMVSLGDGERYVTVYSPKLKKAIVEIFNLQLWIN